MITVLHGTFNKKDRTDDEFSRYKSFSAVFASSYTAYPDAFSSPST